MVRVVSPVGAESSPLTNDKCRPTRTDVKGAVHRSQVLLSFFSPRKTLTWTNNHPSTNIIPKRKSLVASSPQY